MTLAVGIDIGGTKTACVVTDATDDVLHHEVIPTDRTALAAQIVDMARRAIDSVAGEDTDGTRIAAIGVASPGHVEAGRGTAALAVNLGSADIDIRATVESATGVPTFVEHDARAAAAWAYDRDHDGQRDGGDLCYLSIGTGIAAGIVLDGRPLRGDSGLSGEVGHAIVEPDGEQCPCGSHGCLETVAAGPAISRAARNGVASGRQSTLTKESTAADVFRAAAAGDDLATEIANRVGDELARTIRSLVLTLGVRRVVLGGGVASAGDALLAPIRDALDRERRKSPLVESAFAQASLTVLRPDLEPGARGAAAIARQCVGTLQREGVGER